MRALLPFLAALVLAIPAKAPPPVRKVQPVDMWILGAWLTEEIRLHPERPWLSILEDLTGPHIRNEGLLPFLYTGQRR